MINGLFLRLLENWFHLPGPAVSWFAFYMYMHPRVKSFHMNKFTFRPTILNCGRVSRAWFYAGPAPVYSI